MAVKGYVRPLKEAIARFTEGVRDPSSRYKYEEHMRQAFSGDWAMWYNNTMYELISNADEWIDKKGAEKVLAIADIVKRASAEYRKAKLKLFAKRAGRELAETHSLIEEVVGKTIEELLAIA